MEEDKILKQLALAIAEDSERKCKEDLEVFELYTERIRAKTYANKRTFCTRFARGYLLLVEELQKQTE